MRKYSFSLATVITLLLVVLARPISAAALAKFTLTPATGSFVNGSTFTVTLGINSGTDNVVAMDVVGTFDATKLELTSIDKVTSPAFAYDATSLNPIIDNTTGKYEITLSPQSSSIYTGVPANGPLLNFNFKTKAVGTATVNLTCTNGSVTDSNIINSETNDVVDCASNQSGSYTITAGSGTVQPTDTPVTITTTTTTTGTSSELPRTGGIASTMGLIVFGLASGLAAVMLKWL